MWITKLLSPMVVKPSGPILGFLLGLAIAASLDELTAAFLIK